MTGFYPYEDFSIGREGDTPAEAAARVGWPVLKVGRDQSVVARGRAGEYTIFESPTGPRARPGDHLTASKRPVRDAWDPAWGTF